VQTWTRRLSSSELIQSVNALFRMKAIEKQLASLDHRHDCCTYCVKSFEDVYSVLSNALNQLQKPNLHIPGFKSPFILEQRTLQTEAWLDFPSRPWKFRSHFSFNRTGFSRSVTHSMTTSSRYKHNCEANMPTASSKVQAINHHSACWIPIMHCLFLNYRNE